MSVGNEFKEYLVKNATQDQNGTWRLNQKAGQDFDTAHGITPEVQKALVELQTEKLNGAYQFISDKVTERVEAEKKAGKEITNDPIKLTMASPKSTTTLSMKPMRVCVNPQKPGEKITKVASCDLDIEQKRLLDKDMVASYQDKLKATLGY